MNILNFKSTSRSILSDDNARRLTQEFLDGSTTIEQEQTLYRYYATRHIASDLECYRPMFEWYVQLEKQSRPDEVGRPRRKRFIAAAAAIAVLALVGAGLLFAPTPSSGDLSLERMYAGSYIIRDGKKITDIKQILPELRRADQYVDSTLNAQSPMTDYDFEKALIRDALSNINDPEIKAMLLADIN